MNDIDIPIFRVLLLMHVKCSSKRARIRAVHGFPARNVVCFSTSDRLADTDRRESDVGRQQPKALCVYYKACIALSLSRYSLAWCPFCFKICVVSIVSNWPRWMKVYLRIEDNIEALFGCMTVFILHADRRTSEPSWPRAHAGSRRLHSAPRAETIVNDQGEKTAQRNRMHWNFAVDATFPPRPVLAPSKCNPCILYHCVCFIVIMHRG